MYRSQAENGGGLDRKVDRQHSKTGSDTELLKEAKT